MIKTLLFFSECLMISWINLNMQLRWFTDKTYCFISSLKRTSPSQRTNWILVSWIDLLAHNGYRKKNQIKVKTVCFKKRLSNNIFSKERKIKKSWKRYWVWKMNHKRYQRLIFCLRSKTTLKMRQKMENKKHWTS